MFERRIFLGLVLLLLSSVAESIVYFNSSASLAANVSSACLAALPVDIACNASIKRLRPSLYYPQAVLQELCTASCNAALNGWQTRVTSACAGQTYDSLGGAGQIPISIIPQQLRYAFNLSCLTDATSGQYCNVVAATAAGIAADQSNLVNASVQGGGNLSCTDCNLKKLQFLAGSPLYADMNVGSVYKSVTSSCKATGYPLTTTTLGFTPPTPTPTVNSCTGKNYTLKSGDTCESISKSQGIGTSWLLIDNNLPAYCSGFPTSGTLCLNHTCPTYTVKQNDTCQDIISTYNLTLAQILAWNPIFDLKCSNIGNSLNQEICIGSPGAKYIAPTTSLSPPATTATTAVAVPTDMATGTTTDCGMYYQAIAGDYCNLLILRFGISLSDFQVLNPEINENCTDLFAYESYCVLPVGNIIDYPNAPGHINATATGTNVAFTNLPTATYVPALYQGSNRTYANGTRLDCTTYIDGSDYQTSLNGTFYTNHCQLVDSIFSITLANFAFWNPSLGDTTLANCSFTAGLSYCVGWSRTGTELGSGGSNVDSRIMNGTTPNCTTYADTGLRSNCSQVLSDWNITLPNFYSLNPEVKTDCSGFVPNYEYCVSGIPAAPTSKSSTLSPPGPTQTGEPTNCNKWYIATSTDTCSTVETKYGITDAQFHAWNPAVSSDCLSGFWLNEAYCVGIASSSSSTTSSFKAISSSTAKTSTSSIKTTSTTSKIISISVSQTPPGPTQAGEPTNCNKWFLAQSTDTCSSIETKYGITDAQFHAWNPAVSSDCLSGFWAQEAYCIGLSS